MLLQIDFISKLEVGSSITIIEGNNAATEAHAIFCFSPPERENKLFPKRVDIFNSLTVFSKFESICFFGIPTFSHPKTISVSVFTV